MAKKFLLTELKVTSFVTTLNENEEKTSKGGFQGSFAAQVKNRVGRDNWTEYKTQIGASTDTVYSKKKTASRSRFGRFGF